MMGFKFCPMCGEKLISESFKFCPECGYKLNPNEETNKELTEFDKDITNDSPDNGEITVISQVDLELDDNNESTVDELYYYLQENCTNKNIKSKLINKILDEKITTKEELEIEIEKLSDEFEEEDSDDVQDYITHLVNKYEKSQGGKLKTNTIPSAEESRAKIQRNKARFLNESVDFEKEVDKTLAQVHAVMGKGRVEEKEEKKTNFGSFPCHYSEKRYSVLIGVYPEFFDGICTITDKSLLIQGKKRQKVIRYSNISSIEYNKSFLKGSEMVITLSGGNIIELTISPEAYNIINQLWSQGDY